MNYKSLLALILIGSAKVSAAVYTTKPETKFYTEPNGERINIGAEMIETPPLERKDYWCFFKLRDGRGAAINPPAGWTLCSNLNKFVGN
tara:strand:- start:14 stop:280 length:267 start_codon:yes stop_codon:yes gene_type:complete